MGDRTVIRGALELETGVAGETPELLIDGIAVINPGGVIGAAAALHSHELVEGATDVTVSAFELNQALTGISANVTAVNLDELTGGGDTALHSHILADGASDVTATFSEVNQALDGISLGVTAVNLSELVAGGPTALHTHLLANGATDLTVTAAAINQVIGGAGVTVTGAALTELTDGSSTMLHGHPMSQITDVTATAAEIDRLAGVVPGTTTANKALVVDTDKRVNELVIGSLSLGLGVGTPVTSTADELNKLDGASINVTAVNLSELVDGGLTTLHQHNLVTGAADVTASATEINQAMDGIGMTVTAVNLTALTDGTNTSLHLHNLAQGAADVTATTAEINQVCDGVSANVTAANLSTLTGGGNTTLHTHTLATGATDVTATASEIAVLDLSANGSRHYTVSLSISSTPTGAEQSTSFTLPFRCAVVNVFLQTTIAEATGSVKTMQVGLLSSEPGGDTDGFLAGVSCATVGVFKGTLDIGGPTLGALLYVLTTPPSSGAAPEPHMSQVAGAKTVVFKANSNDWTTWRGNIHLDIIEFS